MLAIQDAFCFVLIVLIASIIAACFIRTRKHTPPVVQQDKRDALGVPDLLEALIPD